MRHFALTHSLTLLGGQSSQTRVILLSRKQVRKALPCYWLRLEDADLEEAISVGRTILSEAFNIAVVVAGDEVAKGMIVAGVAEVLAVAGFHEFDLSEYPAASAVSGAA